MASDQRVSMAPFISAAFAITHSMCLQLLPSPVPSHGMHAVTSEFMRSTPAPQVLTTTSLIVGQLLDAAGHRARRALAVGWVGISRQQLRECASRGPRVPTAGVLCSRRLRAVLVWVSSATLVALRLSWTLLMLGSRVARRKIAGASVGSVIHAFW